jgi:hypothetical protein
MVTLNFNNEFKNNIGHLQSGWYVVFALHILRGEYGLHNVPLYIRCQILCT